MASSMSLSAAATSLEDAGVSAGRPLRQELAPGELKQARGEAIRLCTGLGLI
jgi:hypothetical protein